MQLKKPIYENSMKGKLDLIFCYQVESMRAPYAIGAGSVAKSEMKTMLNAIDNDLSRTSMHLKNIKLTLLKENDT